MQRRQKKDETHLRQIDDLFARYRKILRAPQGSVIKEVCDVIEVECGFSVPKEQIAYNVHDRMLYVKTRGVLKQEILLKRSVILTSLKSRLGERSAPTGIL